MKSATHILLVKILVERLEAVGHPLLSSRHQPVVEIFVARKTYSRLVLNGAYVLDLLTDYFVLGGLALSGSGEEGCETAPSHQKRALDFHLKFVCNYLS